MRSLFAVLLFVLLCGPVLAAPEHLFMLSGQQRVAQVAFSPDGALLASASREPALYAADGKQLRPLAGPRIPGLDDVPAYASAFSPSGKSVATAGSWGTRVWDADWFTGSPEGQKNVRWRTANGNMNPARPRLKPGAVKKAAARVR